MTTMDVTSTTGADKGRELVAWAAQLGERAAPHSAAHDRDGTFVTEAFEELRSSGYLALAVPAELGGHGASIAQVAAAQRELARHCAATALASAMHHHIVLFTAWRHRRGLPGAEATLRRVVQDRIVLVSTGGNDLTRPKGTATPTEGGFLLNGRKSFASQVPVGDVFSTMFVLEEPGSEPVVLNLAVPVRAEGVTIHDNWDTLGMRATGSQDVTFRDVFVPEERVLARRPHGVIDPPLQVILGIAIPVITACYLGVAERARDEAVSALVGTPRVEDPLVQRQVGLMDTKLQVMSWALDGALAAVGDDPDPSVARVRAVMAAKREVATSGIEVCDLAMEVAGGAAFFRTSAIERCYRDIRGAKFHPLGPEQTLLHAGRVALGLPADAW